MREQLLQRLDALKDEFETGQLKLRELETQQSLCRERLLRISGAIQVLEELLERGSTAAGSASDGLGMRGLGSSCCPNRPAQTEATTSFLAIGRGSSSAGGPSRGYFLEGLVS
jgi:hypothetical protein